MERIPELVKKRSYVKGKITRVKNQIIDNEDIITFSIKMNKIDEYYLEYMQVQNEIMELSQYDENYEIDAAAIEELIIELKARYEKQKYDTEMQADREREFSDRGSENQQFYNAPMINQFQSTNQQIRPIPVKLPDMKLHSYDGKDPDKWLAFKDTFDAIIHKHEQLSDIQKFHYLQGSLSGEALKLIDTIEYSSIGYKQAWAALLERYDNTRIISENHVNKLLSLKPMVNDSSLELYKIKDECCIRLRALKALGQNTEHWDIILVQLVASRIDAESRKAWEMSLDAKELPTWDDLLKFLIKRARILESLENNKSSLTQSSQAQKMLYDAKFKAQSSGHQRQPQSKNFHIQQAAGNGINSKPSCIFCKATTHYSNQCPEFMALSINQRFGKVKELNICLNCLRTGHRVKECRAMTCKMCHEKHHTLLHQKSHRTFTQTTNTLNDNESQPRDQTFSPPIDNNTRHSAQTVSNINQQSNNLNFQCAVKEQNENHLQLKYVLLSTAIVHILDSEGLKYNCRILLDSASQANFITHSLAKKLKLTRRQGYSSISGLNGITTSANQEITATMHSRISSYKAEVEFAIVPKITDHYPTTNINISNWQIPEDVQLADETFNQSNTIDALIGCEFYYQIIKDGQIKLKENLPILQNSVFGYVFGGKLTNSTSTVTSFSTFTNTIMEQHLNQQLKRFWELESFEEKKFLSEEELFCENHYKETIQRDETGRYCVKLAFKDKHLLGDSKEMALKRFYSLERRLNSNFDLKQQYTEFINEYLLLKHMNLVQFSMENDKSNITEYYMPHHAILKPSSTTTKLRVVFDASAKTKAGYSLNDVLMMGAIYQQDLFSIVVRFRKHKYAFTADIAKMYRQINVHQDDKKLQRILWRENNTDPIKCYELSTITYGTSSAPFLATRTLLQLAQDESQNYPLAASRINDIYMDDVLSGSNNMDDAIKLKGELIKMMASGGMQLRKFSSNSEEILDTIADDSKEQTANELIKTLGIMWDPKIDKFLFLPFKFKSSNSITKRHVVSEVARIYDPLGFLAPMVVKMKVFIQRLWVLQKGWDEKLNENEIEQWLKITREFTSSQSIKITRCLQPNHSIRIEMHGFADASEVAYGACVYLRCIDKYNNVTCNLICSKNRVAPLKHLTIPRLELCAAVELSQLVERVSTSLEMKIDEIYLWSDSSIVLSWIRTPSYQLKSFVAARVSKIQESSNNWFHVDTKQNPADMVSRGITPQSVTESNLWWHGPEYLTKNIQWPQQNQSHIIFHKLPEVKQLKSFIASQDLDFKFIEKFSSINKIIRIMSHCLRFIKCMKTKTKAKEHTFTIEEVNKSTTMIIKIIQKKHFRHDLERLSSGKEVRKSSSIKSLAPFIDQEGLIRVGGRIGNSKRTYDQKHQILLPYKDHFTTLLLKTEHERENHLGAMSLLNYIREKYWPLKGKTQSKSIVKMCIKCFKSKTPKLQSQLMAELPEERVNPQRPFSISGIDYCGPFFTKSMAKRSTPTQKTYLAIFVCFVTKAIHIEVVSDLSSECFMATLRRFISRRGKPSKLFSDNGSNFIGASNELNKLKQFFEKEDNYKEIKDFCCSKSIEWHFIPPRSPHFNGLSEAGVKAVKSNLKRIINTAPLNFEELTTLCAEVEACVNSRPLTPLSDDPHDNNALTAGHFLIGSQLKSFPEPNIVESKNLLKRWQLVQNMMRVFWDRWSKEYLNTLQQRVKWQQTKNNIKVNDLVLLRNDHLPPQSWMLGRIMEIHPGRDGLVRVVSIKTIAGIFKRAITQICKLPIITDGN